jgi:hypothetical protein
LAGSHNRPSPTCSRSGATGGAGGAGGASCDRSSGSGAAKVKRGIVGSGEASTQHSLRRNALVLHRARRLSGDCHHLPGMVGSLPALNAPSVAYRSRPRRMMIGL